MNDDSPWILVLDDDAEFRRLLAEILIDLGYSVYEASTAQEASASLTARQPALAIVDYRLPDLDGASWIKQVRENGFRFPILFITAFFLDHVTYNTLHHVLRVSFILQKPIVPEEFIAHVTRLFPPAHNSSVSPSSAQTTGISQSEGQEMKALLAPQVKHPKAMQDALQAARREYAKELPDVCRELTKLVRAAKEDQSEVVHYKQAVNLAHKLRGSAGSYGFQAISKAGEKAESLLHNLEAEDSTMQEIIWTELFRVLYEVEQIAEKAAAELAAEAGETAVPRKALPRHIILIGSSKEAKEQAEQLVQSGIADTTIAATSEQAVEAAKSRRPDVVLIDLACLNKNEVLSVVRRVRMLPNCDAIPFAVFTESSIEPTPAEKVYMGASVTLKKPVPDNILKRVAQGLIGLREAYMPRVLTIDDDEALCNFVKSILEVEGMLVHAIIEAIHIKKVMEQTRPDVVLVDGQMPSISGYDVCRLIKQDERWAQTRVIFVTARSSAEGRALAFGAGGDDFLPKPVVSTDLINCVRAQLAQSPSMEERLQRDSLTGCLERRPFERAATSLVENAALKATDISLALIEVHGLRELSQTYGLPMGEKLLSQLGALVEARFRAEDVRARLGDFIAILLPGQTAELTTTALQLLASEFADSIFTAPDGRQFSCEIRCGIAQLGHDCLDAIDLIKKASISLISEKSR